MTADRPPFKRRPDDEAERPTALRFDLPDEAATAALAHRIAPLAKPGDVFALWGGLGAGKTVFARAFVRSRGSPEEEVPSPTFTLVQTYEPGPGFEGTVYHFDLFRLGAAEEAYELDIEDAFATGISLIEWPDRLGRLLPPARLDLTLDQGPSPDSRIAVLEGRGSWAERLEALAVG